MNASSWFKSSRQRSEVEVGAVFRHRVPSWGVVETATVLDISSDPMGVPHVTYDLMVERRESAEIHDRRTLGLTTFKERFEQLT